jgi:hypothetical protein
MRCWEFCVHALSVPQFRLNERLIAAQGLAAALSTGSLPQVRLRQLLDVVHHAVQVPLRVDFLVAPVVQARQAFVVPDVGKHRLYRANALAVELPAPGGVNRPAHALTGVGWVFDILHEAGDLAARPSLGLIGLFEALLAECGTLLQSTALAV